MKELIGQASPEQIESWKKSTKMFLPLMLTGT
jgi:hypothetical protein